MIIANWCTSAPPGRFGGPWKWFIFLLFFSSRLNFGDQNSFPSIRTWCTNASPGSFGCSRKWVTLFWLFTEESSVTGLILAVALTGLLKPSTVKKTLAIFWTKSKSTEEHPIFGHFPPSIHCPNYLFIY